MTENTSSELSASGNDVGNRLAAIAGDLAKSGIDLMAMGQALAQSEVLGALSVPVVHLGETLANLGQRLAEVPSQPTMGPMEQTEGEEGDQSDGLQSLQEQLDERKKAWSDYFKDVSGLDKQFTFDSIKNMALQVGEVILGSKKMAKVRKALAIADVIRSRAEAVMTAAKSAPFPLNVPAIAFAVATGQAQQAIVGQTHDGLDKIPNTGTYMLEKGERVIGKRLNQDLSSFLQATNEASAASSIDRSVSRTSNFTPTINLSFGAGVGDDTVLANRGAIETMIREIYADYALQAPFGA